MTPAPSPVLRAGRLRGRGAPLGVAVVVALIGLCILAVDRGASSWTHGMFSQTGPEPRLLPVFVGLTHIVDPLVPLASIGFVVFGVWLVGNAAPPRPLRPLFAACAATLVAIAVKDQLKYALRPAVARDMGEREPFLDPATAPLGSLPSMGTREWSSFPSGHMTLVTTPMVIAMLAWPACRWIAAIPILLVALGLFGADYHFVSDMLAGVLLGTICAVIVWRVVVVPGGERPRTVPPPP